MFMSLQKADRRNKEPFFSTPRSVQKAIPILELYEDGIFLHPNSVYSAVFKFTDVNYSVVGEEEKERIFNGYADLIKVFPKDASVKITINNRKINLNDLREKICVPFSSEDDLDGYRAEYNQMLSQAIVNRNAIAQEKYFTISVEKKNIEDARRFLSSVFKDFSVRLNSVKSTCRQLDCNERLKILHDFYRDGEDSVFNFDAKIVTQLGHSFSDYVCPDYMDLTNDTCIRFSRNKFVRVLFFKEFPNRIKDDFIAQLTTLNREMMLSIDNVVVPMDEAISEVNNLLLGSETNITRWQSRQNKNFNFSAQVPIGMKKAQEECREFLRDLTDYDQQMIMTIGTIVVTAPTAEKLENETEEIISIGKKYACQIGILKWQQLDGLNTVLPIGMCRINTYRTLLTEGVAIFMPFRVQDVSHDNGVYFGQNAESGTIIRIAKSMFQNGNSFVFGIPGSGKSFFVKMEMVGHMLRGDSDVIVVDPQGEYGRLYSALGGEVIRLSPSSNTTINLMDLNKDYKEDNATPIALKSDFLIAFCEQACEGMVLTPIHRSIIIRCTELVYSEYIKNDYQGPCPTLFDFLDELRRQPETEGSDLAVALEMFTSTSFSIFAQPTNVNPDNRFLCYDISALGSTLKAVGMLVMLDSILNRVTENYKNGRYTYVFFDEYHLLVSNPFSAKYLDKIFRTLRKYLGFACGITQNISTVLENETSRDMLSNSEIVVMLNQAPSDRMELSNILKFPPELLTYVTNAPEGHGLMKIADTVIPFANSFPKNTELYRLMTTKASERQEISESLQ